MKTTLEKLPANQNWPELIFPAISNERGAVWLDSSLQIGDKGHFSFIARKPVAEISATIDNLEDSLNQIEKLCKDKNLFVVGYVSYEAGVQFLDLDIKNSDQLQTPLLHFYFYDSALRFDHASKTCEATNPIADDYADILYAQSDLSQSSVEESPKFTETVSKENYLRRVGRIKEHIREGDFYQANYTCRFDVESKTDPFDVYTKLRKLNPAPYGAFLNFGDYQIISSSPERMFKKSGNLISSCPIKGTVPSGNDDVTRNLQKAKLLDSSKDKAELLMIVDLMRNDLGKIAEIGTVEVNNLFTPETYSSVIHLVADVSAKLKSKTTIGNIFKALMPGGSITGTPKKRAVQILQNFETGPRGIYTGCIGYIHGDKADFNIAIRTIIHRNDTYYVHAGGGIVADSDPESEFKEMHLKARNLFKALGIKETELYA